MKEINFLSFQKDKLKREAAKISVYKISVIGFLACYTLVILASLAYYFYLDRQGKLLEEDILVNREAIKKKVSLETKQIYLKSKLASFGGLWQDTKNYQAISEGLFVLIPSGVEITNLKVDWANAISFEGTALNFQALANLLGNLKKGKLNDIGLTLVQLNNVEFARENGFHFQINLTTK